MDSDDATQAKKRRAATIEYVKPGVEDHGILTAYVGIKVDDGGCQAFGGLALDDRSLAAFKEEVLDLFDVEDWQSLVGQRCYALFCRGRHNETIEGLENPFGDRFTITGFRRMLWPDKVASRLQETRDGIVSQLTSHARRAAELAEELKNLEDEFTEWETAPLSRVPDALSRWALCPHDVLMSRCKECAPAVRNK